MYIFFIYSASKLRLYLKKEDMWALCNQVARDWQIALGTAPEVTAATDRNH